MAPENEFVFPAMRIGDRVEVSRDPSEGDKTLGLVRKPKNGSVDILAFYGGAPRLRMSCLHVDDPRAANRPDLFEDNGCGVFRLAHSERVVREMDERLAAIEALQEALVENVARLEDPVVAASGGAKEVKPKGKQLRSVADIKTQKTAE